MLTKASKRDEGEGEPGAPEDMNIVQVEREKMEDGGGQEDSYKSTMVWCQKEGHMPGGRCQQEGHKPGARYQQEGQVKVEGCCGLNPLPTDMHRCEQLTKIHTSGKQANKPDNANMAGASDVAFVTIEELGCVAAASQQQ